MAKRLTKAERKAIYMLPNSALRKIAAKMADPYREEAERIARSEEALLKHSARNVRYSKGGIHERLKQSAKKKQGG